MKNEHQSIAASAGVAFGLLLAGALVFGGDIVRLLDEVRNTFGALAVVKVRNR